MAMIGDGILKKNVLFEGPYEGHYVMKHLDEHPPNCCFSHYIFLIRLILNIYLNSRKHSYISFHLDFNS